MKGSANIRLLCVTSIFMVFALLSSSAAQASRHSRAAPYPDSTGQVGLGVMLGDPTGLSGKVWISRSSAIDFGLAYSFSNFMEVLGDYLYHFHGAFGSSSRFLTELTPYLGLGGTFFVDTSANRTDTKFFTNSGNSAGLGIRIPFGLEWRSVRPPIGVFAELVPGIAIIPGTFGFLEGGVGVRYYF